MSLYLWPPHDAIRNFCFPRPHGYIGVIDFCNSSHKKKKKIGLPRTVYLLREQFFLASDQHFLAYGNERGFAGLYCAVAINSSFVYSILEAISSSG